MINQKQATPVTLREAILNAHNSLIKTGHRGPATSYEIDVFTAHQIDYLAQVFGAAMFAAESKEVESAIKALWETIRKREGV